MKKVKIYLSLIICLTTMLVKAQIVLPTFQASSYVSLKSEVRSITDISNTTAKSLVLLSRSTEGRTTAGICWSTSAIPTTANSTATNSGAGFSFTFDLTSLVINTIYFVRPYIIKNGITIYGEILSFRTANGASTPKDGKLNYVTMNTPGGVYSNNEAEFDAQIQPGYGNIIQTGVANLNPIIDFTARSQLNTAGITVTSNGELFSIVATGFFIPSETGNYRFTCEGDDAVDLFINGVNVANHYGGHAVAPLGTNSNPGIIALTAGVKYSMRARMQEFAGQEALRVFWRKPSQTTGWFQDVNEVSSY